MLEDDPDDRYITREMLTELQIDVPIKFVSQSGDLFDALAGGNKPLLILADYNSTPDDGLAVLKKLKSEAAYRDIPVVILSENKKGNYRKQCYAEGASTVVTKPLREAETKQKIETFFKYWLEVAEL